MLDVEMEFSTLQAPSRSGGACLRSGLAACETAESQCPSGGDPTRSPRPRISGCVSSKWRCRNWRLRRRSPETVVPADLSDALDEIEVRLRDLRFDLEALRLGQFF